MYALSVNITIPRENPGTFCTVHHDDAKLLSIFTPFITLFYAVYLTSTVILHHATDIDHHKAEVLNWQWLEGHLQLAVCPSMLSHVIQSPLASRIVAKKNYHIYLNGPQLQS